MENLLEVSVELSFSEWLIVKRHQLELSQADIAETLNISRQTVGNWEAGRSVPTLTIAQMQDFCKLLQCQIADIPRIGDRPA